MPWNVHFWLLCCNASFSSGVTKCKYWWKNQEWEVKLSVSNFCCTSHNSIEPVVWLLTLKSLADIESHQVEKEATNYPRLKVFKPITRLKLVKLLGNSFVQANSSGAKKFVRKTIYKFVQKDKENNFHKFQSKCTSHYAPKLMMINTKRKTHEKSSFQKYVMITVAVYPRSLRA